jgi:hypothetical protein
MTSAADARRSARDSKEGGREARVARQSYDKSGYNSLVKLYCAERRSKS